jgi:VanZ family protein
LNISIEKKEKTNVIYFIPLITWMIVIFVLSSIPGEFLPKVELTMADKMVHGIVYGVLGILSVAAFSRYAAVQLKSLRWVYAVSIGLGLIYGASDEIHQLFVKGRSCDILDFCADAAGVLFAHFVFYRTHKALGYVSDK